MDGEPVPCDAPSSINAVLGGRAVRAAVVGVGYIGHHHIAALQALKGVEVAVCDQSPARAESTAERFRLGHCFTDLGQMLSDYRPEVVHVTTPPMSHVPLALAALQAGAHVFVEKPIAPCMEQWRRLRDRAVSCGRWVVEDHNYRFNSPVREVLRRVGTGQFGQVMHVDLLFCSSILAPGSGFADPNMEHPTLHLPGGAIGDFLPHLAYLATLFVGPHLTVRTAWSKHASDSPFPHDEMRALVRAKHGTAALAFSAHSQPDAFWLRVYGTKMTANVNLFESRLTFDRVRAGPRPLTPLLNGLAEARAVRRATVRSLVNKLAGGPGVYGGLWELVRQFYTNLQSGQAPPISLQDIDDANRLVADLTAEENRV